MCAALLLRHGGNGDTCALPRDDAFACCHDRESFWGSDAPDAVVGGSVSWAFRRYEFGSVVLAVIWSLVVCFLRT